MVTATRLSEGRGHGSMGAVLISLSDVIIGGSLVTRSRRGGGMEQM